MGSDEMQSKVYEFVAKVLELPGTKNSPEMVSAISELLESLKTKGVKHV
jgi:hypothetical protein